MGSQFLILITGRTVATLVVLVLMAVLLVAGVWWLAGSAPAILTGFAILVLVQAVRSLLNLS